MTKEDKIKLANSKRIHRGWLDTDYDDGDGSSYRALVLTNNDTNEEIRFDTGDLIIDYVLYSQYIASSMKSTLRHINHSSSVGHIVWDTDTKEVYVEWNEDSSEGRVIDNDELMNMPMHEWDKFDKYIFKKDMNTWNDFITYWRNWKKENPGYYEKWSEEVELL
jgi:hypothetical protein